MRNYIPLHNPTNEFEFYFIGRKIDDSLFNNQYSKTFAKQTANVLAMSTKKQANIKSEVLL